MVTFNETGRIEMPRVFIHRKAYLLAYPVEPCLLWTTVKVGRGLRSPTRSVLLLPLTDFI